MTDISTPSKTRSGTMRQSHRLISDAISSMCAQGTRLAVGIVLPPFVLSQIGKEGYGLVVMITTLTAFLAMVQAGTPQALSRFLAEHLALKNHKGLYEILNTSGVLLLIAAGLGVPILAIATTWPTVFFALPASVPLHTVRTAIILMGVISLVSFPLSLGDASFVASSRFRFLNLSLISAMLLRAGLVFGLLTLFPGSLLIYVGVNCLTIILPMALTFSLIPRVVQGFSFRRQYVRKAVAKQIIGYGVEVFANSLAYMFLMHIDYLIIGKSLGSAKVAIFSLALVWSSVIQGLVFSAVAVAVPSAAAKNALGDIASLQLMLIRASKYSCMICAPAIVFLIVFREQLTTIWLGPGFHDVAVIMPLLLLGDLFITVSNTAAQMAIAIGKIRYMTGLNWALSVVNVVLILAGLRFLHFGLLGIACVYLSMFLLRGGVFFPRFMARTLKLPLSRYYAHVYARPLLAAVILAPIAWLLCAFGPFSGWAHLLTSAALLVTAYIPLAYCCSLDSYDRATAVSMLKRVWR